MCFLFVLLLISPCKFAIIIILSDRPARCKIVFGAPTLCFTPLAEARMSGGTLNA
jgi:hypothetical protein